MKATDAFTTATYCWDPCAQTETPERAQLLKLWGEIKLLLGVKPEPQPPANGRFFSMGQTGVTTFGLVWPVNVVHGGTP